MIFSNLSLFQRLKDIREDMDFTQEEIAELLHVSQTSYSRWETGRELIPLRKLNDFCNLTNHSMDYVTGLIMTEKEIYYEKSSLDLKSIGKNIKDIRLKHNLHQYQLAKLLNTTQSTISAYENGETLILTAFIYQIAKQYHLSLDEICNRKELEVTVSSNS